MASNIYVSYGMFVNFFDFFFQAEDGIRDQPRSRGLGDVYKRQVLDLKFDLRFLKMVPNDPK